MNQTKQRTDGLGWWVVGASVAFWVGIGVLMQAVGAYRFEVEGKFQSLGSLRMWRELLMMFVPFGLATWRFLVGTRAAEVAVRPRFWWRLGGWLLLWSLGHAWLQVWRQAFDGWTIVPLTLMYMFFYAAILGFALVVNQRHHAAARERELLAAQLRALRAQLQPHFLFNTLHAIGVTAKADGAAAARMTTLLGDLLRQTLRERDGGLVSLAEEHELLQPYVQLQQLRFGDRLRLDVDLPADVLGGAVPDLVLQPLVENALQHGLEQRPGAGHVRIVGRRHGEQLVIGVHDDGVGLPGAGGDVALGTGLGATRARLAALFGDTASLTLRSNERGGTTAELRLPWREVVHAA